MCKRVWKVLDWTLNAERKKTNKCAPCFIVIRDTNSFLSLDIILLLLPPVYSNDLDQTRSDCYNIVIASICYKARATITLAMWKFRFHDGTELRWTGFASNKKMHQNSRVLCVATSNLMLRNGCFFPSYSCVSCF